MDELQLGEVMNDALRRLPLLCRVVEDGYGRSCGFSFLIRGPIVFKLELAPSMSESSPMVVHDAIDEPAFLGC
jgi:hypothetical protein